MIQKSCLSERLAARGGTCRKPCPRHQSLPVLRGLRKRPCPLHLELTLANSQAQETTFRGQQMARLRKSVCLHTHRATTRQARHRQSRHKGNIVRHPLGSSCDRALPLIVPQQGTSQTGNIASTLGCALPRANVGKHAFLQIPLQVLSAKRDPCGTVLSQVLTQSHFSRIRGNGKTPSIPLQATHMAVYPREPQRLRQYSTFAKTKKKLGTVRTFASGDRKNLYCPKKQSKNSSKWGGYHIYIYICVLYSDGGESNGRETGTSNGNGNFLRDCIGLF